MTERVDLDALEYCVTCNVEIPALERDLLSAIAELRRLRGMEADAERYRWLARRPAALWDAFGDSLNYNLDSGIGGAIDAARKATAP